ncbi:MAG: hypothetical protein KKC18_14225, partial [Chloroflexi bacterium]|nr:hypothetical protein [Chloroflexota bacterium]
MPTPVQSGHLIRIEAKLLIRVVTVFVVLGGVLFTVVTPALAQTKPPPPPTPAPSSPTEPPAQPPAPTPTPIPPTPTPLPTSTPTQPPTSTSTHTHTPTPTDTPTPTHVPTSTPAPSPTPTQPAFSLASLPPWGVPGLAAGGLIGISAILLARRWRGKRRGTSLRSALPYPGIPGRIGRYEIRELLGTGEVATTRKGFDPVLHRDVVVKLLHPHLLGTVAARRMEREGRALARLNYPAIPTVIEI